MSKDFESLLEYKKSTKDWHYNPSVPSVDYQYVGRFVDLTFDENLPQSFKHDVKDQFINVVKSSSGWSKNNRYSRFNVLTGQKPQYENLVTGMPDFVDVNYDFILWTNFIEQMNPLV